MNQNQSQKLTYKILLGMLIGVAVGILINFISAGLSEGTAAFLDDKLTNGLFYIVGQVFLRLLQVLVVPLVLVSLICGTAALGDVKRLGRIGLRTFGLYILTTAIAITFALAAGVVEKAHGPVRALTLPLPPLRIP